MIEKSLEELSFSIENSDYSSTSWADSSPRESCTRIINMKRGIRVINRNTICNAETRINYENNLPHDTAVGAISLFGASNSELYDIKTTLNHKTGNSFWGNVPDENCGSLLPAGKRVNMVYISVKQELFLDKNGEDPCYEFKDNELWHILTGNRRGVCDCGLIADDIRALLNDILQNPLQTQWDWLFFESAILSLLGQSLKSLSTDLSGNQLSDISRDDLARIYYAREVLIDNLEKPLSISELSRKVGLNEFKLKKGFKEVYKSPIFEYLRNYRIDMAEDLIRKGACSITEAAIEVGYSNPSAFSAAFKKTWDKSQ